MILGFLRKLLIYAIFIVPLFVYAMIPNNVGYAPKTQKNISFQNKINYPSLSRCEVNESGALFNCISYPFAKAIEANDIGFVKNNNLYLATNSGIYRYPIFKNGELGALAFESSSAKFYNFSHLNIYRDVLYAIATVSDEPLSESIFVKCQILISGELGSCNRTYSRDISNPLAMSIFKPKFGIGDEKAYISNQIGTQISACEISSEGFENCSDDVTSIPFVTDITPSDINLVYLVGQDGSIQVCDNDTMGIISGCRFITYKSSWIGNLSFNSNNNNNRNLRVIYQVDMNGSNEHRLAESLGMIYKYHIKDNGSFESPVIASNAFSMPRVLRFWHGYAYVINFGSNK